MAEKKISPSQLEEIIELWLEGHSLREIARRFKVTHKTVSSYLNKDVRKNLLEEARRGVEIELAKIDRVERRAWERFRSGLELEELQKITEAVTEGNNDFEVVERIRQQVRSKEPLAALKLIMECIDQRCRILGHYKPLELDVQFGAVDQSGRKGLYESIVKRITGMK